MLGTAVQANPLRAPVRVKLESELGSNDDFALERNKRFAHEFFVVKRPVNFSRVKKSDAAFDGRAEKLDHLLPVRRRSIGKGHAHAAKANGRDFQTAFAEFSCLHFCFSFVFKRVFGTRALSCSEYAPDRDPDGVGNMSCEQLKETAVASCEASAKLYGKIQ